MLIKKCKNFCEQIRETFATTTSIVKFFFLIIDKLRLKLHKIWEKEFLREEL